MNIVLEICIGVVFAILFFLPVVAVYRALVEGAIERNRPQLLEIIPNFIWILCIGIIGGLLVRMLIPQSVWASTTSISRVGQGASTLSGMGIVFVVMISGASLAGRDLKQFANNIGILLRPATVGAAGVIIGSTFVAYALRLTLLNLPSQNKTWETVWRGAVVNANGWIGDSTTLYPTLALVDNGTVGPPTILLDTICGLLWLALATHIVSKHRVENSKSNPVNQQSSQNTKQENRKSAIGMILFCFVGVGAAVWLRTLALQEIPSLSQSFLRPPMAVCTYLLAFMAGYMFARLDSRIASTKVRGKILLFAIGFIGMQYGLNLTLPDFKTIPLTFTYLSIIAIGAFVGHILLLRLFGGTSWGLLFVASMCSIGGLASAPLIAQEYSDDMIEPSYAVALLCNLISLSCFLMWWLLSKA